MQYMLLIYGNEATAPKPPDPKGIAIFKEYGEFTEGIRKSGNFVAGAPLQPTSTATTVRVRDGKRMVTDGPFAETREQLGGYYIVEARNLDEAIAFAAGIPGARLGSIEVRPVLSMG
jgi:hypothetical protein